jgi:hypothetical protein
VLAHVFWIGGPPNSGKTSVARRLARKHDLRLYNMDAYTYDHHHRSLAAGLPLASKWEAMSPDQRWLDAPEQLAALGIAMNEERFALILEDLRRLPSAPAVVVEGAPLLPWLVSEHLASRGHGVWLIPSRSFQRAGLAARPTVTWDATSDAQRALANRIRREELVAEAIERGARERGLATVAVDGSRDLDATTAEVERHLQAALAAAPRAASPEARRALRRDENRTVVKQLRAYLADVPAAGTPETVEFDFGCECGRSGCAETVRLTVTGYEAGDAAVHRRHAG